MSEENNKRIGINIGDAILGALDEKEKVTPSEVIEDDVVNDDIQPEEQQEQQEETQQPEKGKGFLSDMSLDEIQPPKLEEEEEDPAPVVRETVEHEEEEDVQPNDPPRFKKRMEKIKRKLEEEREQLKREYEQRLEEMKSKPAPVDSTPAIGEEERKELLMLRRKFQLDSDPEIQQKYDEPLKANHDKVKSILTRNGMPEDSVAFIEKMGGFDRFAEQMPERARDVIEAVQKANPVEASILQSKIAESISLREGKQRELERASKEADKYFKETSEKKQNEIQQATEAFTKRSQENMQRLKSHADEVLKSATILADVPVTETMGEGEREKAQRINARRALVRQKVQHAISAQTPEEAAEVAVVAAMSFELQAQLKESQEALAKAKAELARLRKAGQTAPRGNLSTVSQPESKAKPTGPKSWIDSFDEGYEQVAQQ